MDVRVWTIKKAEGQRIDAFELWCRRRLLRVPWTARRPNQSILKEISPEYSLEGLMWSWSANTLATWRTDSLEKTLMLGKIEGRRRGRQRMRWLDSITNSWNLLKFMSISRWCHATILSSVVLFSCLQSFPASGSFPMSQFFPSGGPSIGVSASASVLPMSIQDWFLLRWTGWICLQSQRLSRVFSNTTVQKHQFFGAQFSL